MQIQEMLEQHAGILDSLRDEYEAGLKECKRLPSFDDLVRPLQPGST